MSTRCNVLIKDKYDEQWFYRHSDGYPSVTAESLKTFVGWVNEGRIRNNVCQGSGWLIILGNVEYSDMDDESKERGFMPEPGKGSYSGWKVGAYEITTGQHGDIAHMYTIDLDAKVVDVDGKMYTFEDFLKTDFS